MSAEAADLLTGLLVLDPATRLGTGPAGPAAILAMPFYQPLQLDAAELPPLWDRESPFTPTLRHDLDTANFDLPSYAKLQAENMRSVLERDTDEDDEEGANHSGGTEEEEAAASFQTVNAKQLAKSMLDAP